MFSAVKERRQDDTRCLISTDVFHRQMEANRGNLDGQRGKQGASAEVYTQTPYIYNLQPILQRYVLILIPDSLQAAE